MRLRNLIDQINYVELVNIENFDIEIFNVSYITIDLFINIVCCNFLY